MADFMRGSAPLIVIGGRSARHRVGEDIAAVLFEGGASFVGAVGRREVANAEEAAAKVGEKVDVQISVVTLAQSWFNCSSQLGTIAMNLQIFKSI